jgi:hypothetical protein
MVLKSLMERIDPQQDHEKLTAFQTGCPVMFHGKSYVVQQHTTLASGEAALVLSNEKEQFVVGANEFLAGVG